MPVENVGLQEEQPSGDEQEVTVEQAHRLLQQSQDLLQQFAACAEQSSNAACLLAGFGFVDMLLARAREIYVAGLDEPAAVEARLLVDAKEKMLATTLRRDMESCGLPVLVYAFLLARVTASLFVVECLTSGSRKPPPDTDGASVEAQ